MRARFVPMPAIRPVWPDRDVHGLRRLLAARVDGRRLPNGGRNAEGVPGTVGEVRHSPQRQRHAGSLRWKRGVPFGSTRRQAFLSSLLGGQRHAHQLLVIAGEHTPVRKGRMTPPHVPAKGRARGFQHLPAADLLVTLRTELGDEEVSRLARQEEAVAILDEEYRARPYLPDILLIADRLKRLPQPLAGFQFHGPELARLIDTIHQTVFQKRRAIDR